MRRYHTRLTLTLSLSLYQYIHIYIFIIYIYIYMHNIPVSLLSMQMKTLYQWPFIMPIYHFFLHSSILEANPLPYLIHWLSHKEVITASISSVLSRRLSPRTRRSRWKCCLSGMQSLAHPAEMTHQDWWSFLCRETFVSLPNSSRRSRLLKPKSILFARPWPLETSA